MAQECGAAAGPRVPRSPRTPRPHIAARGCPRQPPPQPRGRAQQARPRPRPLLLGRRQRARLSRHPRSWGSRSAWRPRTGPESCRQGPRRCPAARANRKGTHRPQNLREKFRAPKRVTGESRLTPRQEGCGGHLSLGHSGSSFLGPKGHSPATPGWRLPLLSRHSPARGDLAWSLRTGARQPAPSQWGPPFSAPCPYPLPSCAVGGWRGGEGSWERRACTYGHREATPASGKVAAPAPTPLRRRGGGDLGGRGALGPRPGCALARPWQWMGCCDAKALLAPAPWQRN